MGYAGAVVHSVRVTVRNPFAVVLVSLATSASLLPFVTGFLLAGGVGALAGLWTTSFLLGFVAVGAARIFTVVLEREVSLGTAYFWEGLRRGDRMGLAVGAGTFVAGLVAAGLSAVPGGGIVGLSFDLLGVYLLLSWFVLAIYALALWAVAEDPDDLRTPFVRGGTLILERPVSAGWVLVQTVGWTLLSIPLVIAPVLVLPGLVGIIGVAIARAAAAESDAHGLAADSD